jgi:hypothetical protein
MATRVFRTAIFAGVLLAVWTLGRPANAAVFAPFCDDRGATALAAAPALEAPDEAIRRAAAAPCDTDEPIFRLALGPARRTLREAPTSVATGVETPPSQLLPPPVDAPLTLVAREAPPQSGVRYRIERPPRA